MSDRDWRAIQTLLKNMPRRASQSTIDECNKSLVKTEIGTLERSLPVSFGSFERLLPSQTAVAKNPISATQIRILFGKLQVTLPKLSVKFGRTTPPLFQKSQLTLNSLVTRNIFIIITKNLFFLV